MAKGRTLGRLTLLVIGVGSSLIGDVHGESPAAGEALVIRLVHPERQAAEVLKLFDGARARIRPRRWWAGNAPPEAPANWASRSRRSSRCSIPRWPASGACCTTPNFISTSPRPTESRAGMPSCPATMGPSRPR